VSGAAENRTAARRRHRRQRSTKDAREHGSKLQSEINVTPFVDVVLVLLIIFMVVTPMLQRGLDVQLPRSRHHQKMNDTGEQIIISVDDKGQVYLGQDAIRVDALEQQLRKLLRRQPVPPIFIKGDKRLVFSPIRKVLEAAHRAGAPSVSLATEEQKD
jgi:biopolymer transport protein ExbD